LTILAVKAIDKKLTGQPRSVCYRLPMTPAVRPGSVSDGAPTVAYASGPEGASLIPADLPQRIAALLQTTECWVERTRPTRRRIDVRPLLRDIRLSPDSLEIDLWVTPTGAARPEEVLGLLGLAPLLDAGAVLERTR